MSVPGLVWRVCLAVLMSTAVAHADEGRALRIWLDARLVASGPATIVVSSDDGRTSTREIQLDVSQPVGRIDGLADGDYDIRMTLADGRNGLVTGISLRQLEAESAIAGLIIGASQHQITHACQPHERLRFGAC